MANKWLFKNESLYNYYIINIELQNPLVETMNWIVENIIDLLLDKSYLSSPYRSVFVRSSSCLFKMLLSIFLILIKRHCLADWKSGLWRKKLVVVSISRMQSLG